MFFLQAVDGIRDLVRSRGLGDVYKRQVRDRARNLLTDEVRDLALKLARRRAAIHAVGQSTEDIDWAVIIDDALGPADGALSASDGAQPEAGPHCLSSAKA